MEKEANRETTKFFCLGRGSKRENLLVYGDVEETLDLRSMEIHGDDMLTTSSLQHVCDQFGRDWRSALVLLVLSRIREVGKHSRNPSCRCGLASVDHDQKLHQPIVDFSWGGGLQNEHILISNTFTDGNAGFQVRILENHDLRELDS